MTQKDGEPNYTEPRRSKRKLVEHHKNGDEVLETKKTSNTTKFQNCVWRPPPTQTLAQSVSGTRPLVLPAATIHGRLQ